MAEEAEKLDIQKKAFGRWINARIGPSRTTTDLFFDLRDGQILHDLVSALSQQKKKIKREQGSIRVHKLRNVDLALNALREDRVKVPSNVSSADIVDGDSKATLDLVWAIILHWQFLKVLQQSSTATLNSVEKPLLLWCQIATSKYQVEVKDFTRSLADGLALCCIIHYHKSDLFDLEQARAKSPRERLEFVFRIMEQHFGVARILDPEDVHTLAPDKKAVMTYVMSMFEVLPHDFLQENDEAIVETVNLGSPVKNPSSLKSGKLLDYDTFCRLHEDVHAWLLDAEDKLKFMQSVSNDLNVVKRQFDDNAEYMSELDTHQKAVGEVIRKGRHLLYSNLTSYQEKDVRVRKKVLIDSWEGLRKQALDRQNVLHEKLMALQRSEMQKLRNWMTETEDKISRISVVGCTMDTIEAQEMEHRELEKSLEDQHDTVHSISNFIYVETENGARQPDNSKAGDEEEIDETDLEGQLMALGERWTVLCTWVEERAEILRITRDELELLEREKDRLIKWLDLRESALREMDRNPSENHEELGRQGRLIAAIQKEWSTEQRALLNINSVAEKLVSRCIATSPENGSHPDSFKEDAASFAKTVEAIQDRWDILTEILEAQKQRVSRQGIDIGKMSHMAHKIDLRDDLSGGEENTPNKKRRITGTKRIEFETSYAKASSWLQKVLEELEELPEAKLEAVKRLEAEIKEWRGKIGEAVSLGEDLMGDIQNEHDFPPDYLNNVLEKVKLVRDQMALVETKVPDLLRNLAYESKKAQLYANLEELTRVLLNYETWLREPTSSESDLSREIAAMKANLTSHNDKLSQLKRLANETLLHPGAAGDPANKIKADLYRFCEHWDGLESRLADHHAKLLRNRTKNENLLEDIPAMEDKVRRLQAQTGNEKRAEALKELLDSLKGHHDAVEGITLWMQEVSGFLVVDDAPFGDVINLECQMKDSDALIADIQTLMPKLDSINSTGGYLLTKCEPQSATAKALESELDAINAKWKEMASMAQAQNARVKNAYDRSKKLHDSLDELQSFVSQMSKDLPDNSPVKKPTELSQRTFKLLHSKDKIERKRGLYESLMALQESPELMASSQALLFRITQVEESWKGICDPIVESYKKMKMASTGIFA